jgi:hypothetical protein
MSSKEALHIPNIPIFLRRDSWTTEVADGQSFQKHGTSKGHTSHPRRTPFPEGKEGMRSKSYSDKVWASLSRKTLRKF